MGFSREPEITTDESFSRMINNFCISNYRGENFPFFSILKVNTDLKDIIEWAMNNP